MEYDSEGETSEIETADTLLDGMTNNLQNNI